MYDQFRLGVFGFKLAFDAQADVMFNMTLLHQEYVNGTYEKSNCVPFNPIAPCYGEFTPRISRRGKIRACSLKEPFSINIGIVNLGFFL